MEIKYINPPLNYTGSKYKLLEQILPRLDYSKNRFIDLFTGGGSVYSNVLDKYDKVLANDIIEDLVGIHQGLLENDNIVELTKNLCPGKDNPDGYQVLRNSYNANKSPEGLWALMLSCTNNMLRFNKKFKFNQTYGKRGFSDSTQLKTDLYSNHIRKYKDKIFFTSNHFSDITIIENAMYYIDPPYGFCKNVDGSISNKQISEAGYNCYWEKQDDVKLFDLCLSINNEGGSFMISGVLTHNTQTCWVLDKLIEMGFNYTELDCNYDKVSRNKIDKKTVEVIITNY